MHTQLMHAAQPMHPRTNDGWYHDYGEHSLPLVWIRLMVSREPQAQHQVPVGSFGICSWLIVSVVRALLLDQRQGAKYSLPSQDAPQLILVVIAIATISNDRRRCLR